jgi:hypothetical protein
LENGVQSVIHLGTHLDANYSDAIRHSLIEAVILSFGSAIGLTVRSAIPFTFDRTKRI